MINLVNTDKKYSHKMLFIKHNLVWGMGEHKLTLLFKTTLWLKGCIVLLLKLKRTKFKSKVGFYDFNCHQAIPFITYDHSNFKYVDPSYNWQEIAIGRGLFRNWWYCEYENGT